MQFLFLFFLKNIAKQHKGNPGWQNKIDFYQNCFQNKYFSVSSKAMKRKTISYSVGHASTLAPSGGRNFWNIEFKRSSRSIQNINPNADKHAQQNSRNIPNTTAKNLYHSFSITFEIPFRYRESLLYPGSMRRHFSSFHVKRNFRILQNIPSDTPNLMHRSGPTLKTFWNIKKCFHLSSVDAEEIKCRIEKLFLCFLHTNVYDAREKLNANSKHSTHDTRFE